jgi:hypothetical protein
VVLNVLYGVCVALGLKTSLDEVSKFLKKPADFIQTLKDYNPEILTI